MGRTSTAKARLIATAMDIMYVRGYTAVGVHEICTQAGVHKGSFYHFFPSKQALVLAVIDTYGEHIRGLWEDVMTADGSLRERLQRGFAHTYSAHYQLRTGSDQLYGCPLGNLALELGSQAPVVRQKLHDMFTAWARVIERSLREAMASGALPALDPVTTAQTLLAYFEGVMLLAKTQNTPEVITQLAHGAVALVEAAAGASLSAKHG
jgi:TetR/AcrR family transcriptional regulator, transcriptional repressor for nem operon